MDKNTNVQSNKNTNVTIQSELALYQRTGNSTHARTIADRLALALELGNIGAGFLLGLDTRLQLVPSTGGNVSSPFTDKRRYSEMTKTLLVEAMYSDSEGCVCCTGRHRFATVLKDGSDIFDHAEMIQSFVSGLPNDSEVRINLSYTRPMPGAVVDREALVKDDYRGDYVGRDDGHHMSW